MDIGASTYCFPRGEQIAHAVDQNVEGSNQKSFFQRSENLIIILNIVRIMV